MKQEELIIISAYPELTKLFQEICAEKGVQPVLIEATMEKAVAKLQEVLKQYGGLPEVVVSRGATAELVRQSIAGLTMVRAEPNDVDIIRVLFEATLYGQKVGFLVYPESDLVEDYQEMRRIAGFAVLRIYPYVSSSDLDRQIARAKQEGIEVLVGGGLYSMAVGRKYGIPVLFITSGKRAVRGAVERALSIVATNRREKAEADRYRALLGSVKEGIISLNGQGQIKSFNRAAEKIFGIGEWQALGKAPGEVHPILAFEVEGSKNDKVCNLGDRKIVIEGVPMQSGVAANGEASSYMIIVQDVTDIRNLEEGVRRKLYAKGLMARFTLDDIKGESQVIAEARNAAREYAITDATVMITGESGTGKELFAQGIHTCSPRRAGPFVAVNCAAIPESLLESELFGYEEGAFTGAKKGGQPGLFELAHGGSIFLDEIDSLPLGLQGRLLRVVQEREVRRLGADKVLPVDVRILVGTNKNILKMVESGTFRSDLYYRLSVLTLALPPLRDRQGDAIILAGFFLQLYAGKFDKKVPALTGRQWDILESYSWPGNVRELENVIQRYVILYNSELDAVELLNKVLALDSRDVQAVSGPGNTCYSDGDSLTIKKGSLGEMEKQIIEDMLIQNRWNRTEVAAQLGINRSTLWRKLKG